MDINQMLSQLREERENIEQAILALERLARSAGKRRGRPPKWISEVTGEGEDLEQDASREARGKSRRFSPEARKRMAEAQRRRWATQRQEKAAAAGDSADSGE
jgi:hypothetical protein